MHGLIVLVLIFAVSRGLKLTLFSWLLDQLMLIVMVGLPIIFQGELKRGLEYLGRKNPMLRWFIKTSTLAPESISAAAEAAAGLAQKRTGALIVFERENPLSGVTDSGSYIDAVLSKIMIEQIFYHNSPLHDGALVIKDNRIHSAGCFLPLDNGIGLPQELGSRHRAGLSLALQSDAVVVVVSEETGRISVAVNGILETGFSKEGLQGRLAELLRPQSYSQPSSPSPAPGADRKEKVEVG